MENAQEAFRRSEMFSRAGARAGYAQYEADVAAGRKLDWRCDHANGNFRIGYMTAYMGAMCGEDYDADDC